MKYRETLTGKIPEDWEVVRLIDIADYINGYAFSPKEWKDKGFPIIRIQNLNDPEAEFNYFDGEIDDKYIVETGDLLFSWSASIGVYIWNRGKAVLNQHIFKVVPKENVDKLYFYYALYLAIEQLKNRVHGSTMKHFKRSELRTTFVLLPPLLEQKKIAEILSTVDKAIQKVDEIIAKTERLKKGLMQKLLTKGIGHDEFKYSEELGCEIPKEWEVVKLGDILILIRNGLTYKQNKGGQGYPITRIETISEEKINPTKVGFVNNLKMEEIEEYKLIDGDILFSHINSLEHIGKTAIYDGVPKLLLHGMNLLLLRSDKLKVKPYYLLYLLKLYRAKEIFRNIAKKAVNQASINQTELKRIKITLPPLQEQQKIAEILSTVDKKLELERKRKEKFERIKKGLMNDLLTGKKRVKI